MCRVPILSKQPEFGGFRLLYWLCWGGRPGIGPKWANMVQNTTKVVISAIVWGQTGPSSSYPGRAGTYSIETPCTLKANEILESCLGGSWSWGSTIRPKIIT